MSTMVGKKPQAELIDLATFEGPIDDVCIMEKSAFEVGNFDGALVLLGFDEMYLFDYWFKAPVYVKLTWVEEDSDEQG